MEWRVAGVALLFRKALRLSLRSVAGESAGKLVNVAATDLDRLTKLSQMGAYLFLAPLEAAAVTAMIWIRLGPSSLAGLGVLAALCSWQGVFGTLFGRLRARAAAAADERLRVTASVVTGARVFKACAWEARAAEGVNVARAAEMDAVRAAARLRAINEGVFTAAPLLSSGAVFLARVLSGGSLKAADVFVCVALLSFLQVDICKFFVVGIEGFAEARVTMKRIEGVLRLSEGPSPRIIKDDSVSPPINARQLSASWSLTPTAPLATSNVDLVVNRGEVVCVLGAVGAGKTSLLLALLGELGENANCLPFGAGYAEQSSFLLSDSVRENIVAGREWDAARYGEVIQACALTTDLRSWPAGDSTRVGERGVTLSGGQRARIVLARALYGRESAYVFDDPLAAVDATVGAQLWATAIRGPLVAHAAVVIVTHHVQYASKADRCLILDENGTVKATGTWKELEERARSGGGGIGPHLLALLMGKDEKTEAPKLEPAVSAPQAANLSSVANAGGDGGGAQLRVTAARAAALYMSSYGPRIAIIVIFVLLLGGAILAAGTQVVLANWCAASPSEQRWGIWPALFGGLVAASSFVSMLRACAFFEGAVTAAAVIHNLALYRVVRAPLAWFDSNASGRVLNRFSKDVGVVDDTLPLVAFDFFNVSSTILATIGLVLLANPWLALALFPLICAFAVLRGRYVTGARVVKALEASARSPIFGLLSEVIEGLPSIRAARGAAPALRVRLDAVLDAHSRAYFAWLAAARWLGVRLDALCLALLGAFALAAAGSRGSSISPALVGLALSQAIGMANAFQWAVRQSSELETLLVSAQRLIEYAEIEPVEDVDMNENAAAAAAQAAFARGQKQLASAEDVEISLSDSDGLPTRWPLSGTLAIAGLRLRYTAVGEMTKGPWILNGVNFSIESGHRVGVVGRTGAGKSSLLSALLRLTEPARDDADPSICGVSLDGVDIARVPLSRLRRSFSYIPQEPLLLSGTIRDNLDPFSLWDDERVWEALRDAQMSRAVELAGGLGARVDPGGGNWSVGQRQCLCLARALLRDSRVLVLDEASANIDADTDAALQAALRGGRFKGVTIISIAHRLNTIIDFDQVIVLNAGTVVENGAPSSLLRAGAAARPARPDGVGAFYLLVHDGGPKAAAQLIDAADAAEKHRAVRSQ
jgi:ATP-binding cassette subfamily C (CFTR/MRP) protein 4